MKNFRFRLDPVLRLKRYAIEKKEEEIRELEVQIQRVLEEMERQQMAVQQMRRDLLNGKADHELIHAERAMDLFRAYSAQVEEQKRSELMKLRTVQTDRKNELIELYQEEKILERLKEKRQGEWNGQAQKEENALMDEIGTQKFVRREREHGGILLYILAPIAIAATAAVVGLYTGFIDRSVLEKIPIIGERIHDATETVEVHSATPEVAVSTVDAYTVEQMLSGGPDTPIPEILQNVAKQIELIQEEWRTLEQRKRDLDLREQNIKALEEQVAGDIQFASGQIETLRNLKMEMEENEKSEASEREVQLAAMVSGGKVRSIAPVITSMFQGRPADPPEVTIENQRIVLRILHRMQERKRSELMQAIAGESPEVAAQIMSAFMNTTNAELYGIDMPQGATDTVQASPELSPPTLIDESGKGRSAGG